MKSTVLHTLEFALTALRLVLFTLPATAAEWSIDEPDFVQHLADGGHFSGDDAYDPAAGGRAISALINSDNYSGDDAYEPGRRWANNVSARLCERLQ